jgi:hypothetical protein
MTFKYLSFVSLLILTFSCSNLQNKNSISRAIAELNNLCPDLNNPTTPTISDAAFYKNYKVCCVDDLNTDTILSAYNHELKGCETEGKDKLTIPERLSLLAYTSKA